jgi:hypothetical protein
LEIKTLEETVKEIIDGYNRKPYGWQIASDFWGNSVVLGPGGGYRLKLMMVNPQESLGVGARIDDVGELRRSMGEVASSGFRPLNTDIAKEVFSALSSTEEAKKQRVIRRVLDIDPVPTWELQASDLGAVMSGPFIAHPDLRVISRKQSELDERLAAELDKLFRLKHPMRASIYR